MYIFLTKALFSQRLFATDSNPTFFHEVNMQHPQKLNVQADFLVTLFLFNNLTANISRIIRKFHLFSINTDNRDNGCVRNI